MPAPQQAPRPCRPSRAQLRGTGRFRGAAKERDSWVFVSAAPRTGERGAQQRRASRRRRLHLPVRHQRRQALPRAAEPAAAAHAAARRRRIHRRERRARRRAERKRRVRHHSSAAPAAHAHQAHHGAVSQRKRLLQLARQTGQVLRGPLILLHRRGCRHRHGGSSCRRRGSGHGDAGAGEQQRQELLGQVLALCVGLQAVRLGQRLQLAARHRRQISHARHLATGEGSGARAQPKWPQTASYFVRTSYGRARPARARHPRRPSERRIGNVGGFAAAFCRQRVVHASLTVAAPAELTPRRTGRRERTAAAAAAARGALARHG